MKALIHNNTVVQVVDDSHDPEMIFPVAPGLYWLDCCNECAYGWVLTGNGTLTPPTE